MIGHRCNVTPTPASMSARSRVDNADSGHPAGHSRSSGHDDRPEPGYYPNDAIGQVTGNAKLVQGAGQVGGGAVEVGVADVQAAVGGGQVRSPVVLAATERFAQGRHQVRPVPGTDPLGEESGEFRVGQHPPVEVVDGRGQGGPAADRLVDADLLHAGGGCVLSGGHGHSSSPRAEVIYHDTVAGQTAPRLSNEYSLRAAAPD